ncbi:MAG: iron-sulfur cluster assembly scaffold protein [Candidatus Omnitrophota bacterium]
MSEYTDKVMDHFQNPRNVGTIADPSGIGKVTSSECGDIMELHIKVDDNGIITDAKFKTFGCAAAIASSSMLTEMIIGKNVAEAEKITNNMIVKSLGGLPEMKVHCSVLGENALKKAIDNYYKSENAHKKTEK